MQYTWVEETLLIRHERARVCRIGKFSHGVTIQVGRKFAKDMENKVKAAMKAAMKAATKAATGPYDFYIVSFLKQNKEAFYQPCTLE